MTTPIMPVLTGHSETADGTRTRIDLTFNTAMNAGRGKIYVTDGALQTVIDPATGKPATRIAGASHTIEIKLSDLHFSGTHVYADGLDLKPGHQYSVLIEPGALASAAGLAFAGLGRPGLTQFTTPSGAPSGATPKLEDILLLNDLGRHDNDFLTSGANQQLEGAINGTLAPGQRFELLIGGTLADPAYLTVNEISEGSMHGYVWNYDGPLPEGESTVTARIMSGASKLDEKHVDITVDRVKPAVVGSPDGETALSLDSAVVITFSERVYWEEAEGAAGQLMLKDGDGNVTYVAMTSASLSDGGTRLTIPAADLHLVAGADYRIYLPGTLRDLAGNALGEYAIGFHTAGGASADTTAPHALTAKVTNAAGSYNAGKPIEIRVAFDEPIALVDGAAPKLVLNNGGIAEFYAVSGSSEAVFHYTVGAGGDIVQLDISSAASLVGSFRDLAGNLLGAGGLDFAGLANAAGLPDSGITIDTIAPNALGTPALDEASDSGLSHSDGITTDNTPTFTGTGAEAFATIELFSGSDKIGQVSADADGNWTITSNPLVTDGIHWITAKQIDKAGNESAASPAFKLTIDDSNPPAITSVTSSVAQGGTFFLKFSDLIYIAGSLGAVDVYRNGTLWDTIRPGDAEWIVETDSTQTHEYTVLELAGLIDGSYRLDFTLSSPVNLVGIAANGLLDNDITFTVGLPPG